MQIWILLHQLLVHSLQFQVYEGEIINTRFFIPMTITDNNNEATYPVLWK